MARDSTGAVVFGRTVDDVEASPGQVFVAIPMGVDAVRRVMLTPDDRLDQAADRFMAMCEEHSRPQP